MRYAPTALSCAIPKTFFLEPDMTYRRSQNHRKAFTLVELLVVITIISLLVALLLPGIQSARESGRNALCQNNLKQLGLGALNYEHIHGGLPPASIFPQYLTNPSTLSDSDRIGWVWLILPFMEQSNLADQYHFDRVWFDPALQPLVATRLSIMECPTDPVAGKTFSGADTDPVSMRPSIFRRPLATISPLSRSTPM